MDGKALRGTRTLDQRALMLISAFDHQITCVLLQQAVPAEANEQKAALDLLRRMVLTGRVVTADAAHCYLETCQQIVDSGGHDVLTAKDNQPTLVAAISSEFTARVQAKQRRFERQSHTAYDKGHGRREKRTIETTIALNVFLKQRGWSSVQQVFRITRQRTFRDHETSELKTTTEVAHGIIDLTRDQANAERLLEYNRAHWGIENTSHHARCDVRRGCPLGQIRLRLPTHGRCPERSHRPLPTVRITEHRRIATRIRLESPTPLHHPRLCEKLNRPVSEGFRWFRRCHTPLLTLRVSKVSAMDWRSRLRTASGIAVRCRRSAGCR